MKINFVFALISIILGCSTTSEKELRPKTALGRVIEINKNNSLYSRTLRDSITQFYENADFKNKRKILGYLNMKPTFWFDDIYDRIDKDSIARIILIGKIPKFGHSLINYCDQLKTTRSQVAKIFFKEMMKDTSKLFRREIPNTMFNSYSRVVIPAKKSDLAFDCFLFCNGIDPDMLYSSFINEDKWEKSKIYKYGGSVKKEPWISTNNKVNKIRNLFIDEMTN